MNMNQAWVYLNDTGKTYFCAMFYRVNLLVNELSTFQNFAATFRISNYLTFTGKENCDRESTENPQNNQQKL